MKKRAYIFLSFWLALILTACGINLPANLTGEPSAAVEDQTIAGTEALDEAKLGSLAKIARDILYTPLAQTFLFAPDRAVAFIGTADPWSSTEEIIRLSEENHIPITVYEGCNHSLECDDTLKNIENLKDVMQRTEDFCRKIN